MVEKGLFFVSFFSSLQVCRGFFKKPIYLVYHCCVYKSYRIILNYKVLEFFSQTIIVSELYIIQLQMCNIL